MSITKDANYAKMNYKNSESTYENLTPTALANKVNYNQNDLCYNPTGSYMFRNNLKSTNVADAITEIENRVAQCGRKFDELEFGAGKDIDLLDGVGNQITLDTYYIGNIVYFPKTQKYYMLLYSFIYGRSVLLSSRDGILWEKDSDITTYMLIDIKCNSQYIYFIGYDSSLMRGLYYSTMPNGFLNLLNYLEVKDTYGDMLQLPTTQYNLGLYFRMSFDMDENSILCLSLRSVGTGYEIAYRADNLGNFTKIETKHRPLNPEPACVFPKILNINPGQYIYYMKGSSFNPEIKSFTKDSYTLTGGGIDSNTYDILLMDKFELYASVHNSSSDGLRRVTVVSPNRISIGWYDSYAPELLLANKCCNNYIFFNDYEPSNVKYWGYNNYFKYNLEAKSINDSNNNTIGDNYKIKSGFNPSFINKINDKLFIYVNNEATDTTINNSKLYISQIKI